MSNFNIENLFEAIKIINTSQLEELQYDKTIVCTITELTDPENGKYLVTDGSIQFYAFGEANGYNKDDNVYITIPNGDWNEQKLISGKKINDENEAFALKTPFSNYIDVSGNLLALDKYKNPIDENVKKYSYKDHFKLTANKQNIENESVVANKYRFSNQQKSLFEYIIPTNITLKGYTTIGLKAGFQAWMSSKNVALGHYGLHLLVEYEKTIKEEVSISAIDSQMVYTTKTIQGTHEFKLDSSEFFGNAFYQEGFKYQEKIFKIAEDERITGFYLYFYQLPGTFINDQNIEIAVSALPNLAVDDIQLSLGYTLDEFDGEKSVIYTNNSLTYNTRLVNVAGANKKHIEMRWIHELDSKAAEGLKVDALLLDSNDDNIEIYNDNNKATGEYYDYHTRWYRYNLGSPSADMYSGAYWDRIYPEVNPAYNAKGFLSSASATIKVDDITPGTVYAVRTNSSLEKTNITIKDYTPILLVEEENNNKYLSILETVWLTELQNQNLIDSEGNFIDENIYYYYDSEKYQYKKTDKIIQDENDGVIEFYYKWNWNEDALIIEDGEEKRGKVYYQEPDSNSYKKLTNPPLTLSEENDYFYMAEAKIIETLNGESPYGILILAGGLTNYFIQLPVVESIDGDVVENVIDTKVEILSYINDWQKVSNLLYDTYFAAEEINPTLLEDWIQKQINLEYTKKLDPNTGELLAYINKYDEEIDVESAIKLIQNELISFYSSWLRNSELGMYAAWLDTSTHRTTWYSQLAAAAHHFEIDFEANVKLAQEKIKSCVYFNEKAYMSNVLEFTNAQEVPSAATIEATRGLYLVCNDNTCGNYMMYSQGGSLIGQSEPTKIRTIGCRFDPTGEQGENEAAWLTEADSISWKIPITNTMIQLSNFDYSSNTWMIQNDVNVIRKVSDDGQYAIITYLSQNNEIQTTVDYTIASHYSASNVSNTITCCVNRFSTNFYAAKDLTFGIMGTSGTDYTLVIDLENNVNSLMVGRPAEDADGNGGDTCFVKAILYNAKNEIITESELKEANVSVDWSWLSIDQDIDKAGIYHYKLNNYITITPDLENIFRAELSVPEDTLDLLSGNDLYILSCTIDGWGDYSLTAYLPIPLRRYRGDIDFLSIEGTTEIIYNSMGTATFHKMPYSISTTRDDKVVSTRWQVVGKDWKKPILIEDKSDFNKKLENYGNIYILQNSGVFSIIQDYDKNISNYYIDNTDEDNRYLPTLNTDNVLEPLPVYIPNSYCGVQCLMITETFNEHTGEYERDGDEEVVWLQPILSIQNRYPSAMINKWDGKLKIDEENGAILSTMMAAGRKNSDNTFSGIMLGDWAEHGDESLKQTGLYGFKNGGMSFGFLEDGTGFMGQTGHGRILFDGERGQITSPDNGSQSMIIDLDDAYIKMTKYGKQSSDVALNITNADDYKEQLKTTSLYRTNFKINDVYYKMVEYEELDDEETTSSVEYFLPQISYYNSNSKAPFDTAEGASIDYWYEKCEKLLWNKFQAECEEELFYQLAIREANKIKKGSSNALAQLQAIYLYYPNTETLTEEFRNKKQAIVDETLDISNINSSYYKKILKRVQAEIYSIPYYWKNINGEIEMSTIPYSTNEIDIDRERWSWNDLIASRNKAIKESFTLIDIDKKEYSSNIYYKITTENIKDKHGKSVMVYGQTNNNEVPDLIKATSIKFTLMSNKSITGKEQLYFPRLMGDKVDKPEKKQYYYIKDDFKQQVNETDPFYSGQIGVEYFETQDSKYINIDAQAKDYPLSIGTSGTLNQRNFKVKWDGTLEATNGYFEDGEIEAGTINGSKITGGSIFGSKIIGSKLYIPLRAEGKARDNFIAFYPYEASEEINHDFPTDEDDYVGYIGWVLGTSDGIDTTYNLGINTNIKTRFNDSSIILESGNHFKAKSQGSCYIDGEGGVFIRALNDGGTAPVGYIHLHADTLEVKNVPPENQSGIYARFA